MPALDFYESNVLIAYTLVGEDRYDEELAGILRRPFELGLVGKDSRGRPSRAFHDYVARELRPALEKRYQAPRFLMCLWRTGEFEDKFMPIVEFGTKAPSD